MEKDIKINPVILEVNEKTWLDTIEKPLYSRPKYKGNQENYTFGQVVIQFLGIPKEVEDYLNYLYDIVHDPKLKIQLLTRNHMERFISENHFQELQKIYLAHKKYHFSIDKLLALMDGKELFPLSNDKKLNRHYRKALTEVLNKFKNNHKEELLDSSFRRVMIDIVKWSWNYLDPWFKNLIIEKEMPKVLWYGEVTKSNIYFLELLIQLGCDLSIFNPNGENVLDDERKDHSIYVYQYPDNIESLTFPQQKVRKGTIAYKASKEIEKVFDDNKANLYKPWQFRHYIPVSYTLRTTYDELFLIIKEKAFVRPYFSVENQVIRIPNIFAKVSGISEDENEYWERIDDITSDEFTLLVKQFPFTNTSTIKKDYFNEVLSNNKSINPKKIMSSHWWKYNHLPEELQRAIAAGISRLCPNIGLKQGYNETIQDVQMFLFSQAISLSESVQQLLQKFDYAQQVPRIILYKNENNGRLSRADAAILLLLNELGIDILLYNPTGNKDLEQYIKEDYFDHHWLEDVVFNQDFKEKSIVQRVVSNVLKSFKEE